MHCWLLVGEHLSARSLVDYVGCVAYGEHVSTIPDPIYIYILKGRRRALNYSVYYDLGS